MVADDADADFTLITNEGTNIGDEGTTIPGPMLLLLPAASLDEITGPGDVPAYNDAPPWITNSGTLRPTPGPSGADAGYRQANGEPWGGAYPTC